MSHEFTNTIQILVFVLIVKIHVTIVKSENNGQKNNKCKSKLHNSRLLKLWPNVSDKLL